MELPDADRVPDFPPGPRGPEENVPGVTLTLSSEQLQKTFDFLKSHPRCYLQLEDRGAGYVKLTALADADGTPIAEVLLHAV